MSGHIVLLPAFAGETLRGIYTATLPQSNLILDPIPLIPVEIDRINML